MTDPAAASSPARHQVAIAIESRREPLTDEWLTARLARGAHGEADTTSVLRVAPLLVVTKVEGLRLVAVGTAVVVVSVPGYVGVEAQLAATWRETSPGGTLEAVAALSMADHDALARRLRALAETSVAGTSREAAVTGHAKVVCEASRNAVRHLRELRYELEDRLAGSSATTAGAQEHTAVVSALLQLNIVCGRAADQAREASREGLWVWLTDPDAYQAYRRGQDPTLINEHEPATHQTRSWMRTHDAAVRQCQTAKRQLDHEHAAILALLSSAASLAVAREADAQSRFNLLVALLSLGLGVPTLVLALYSTDRILPLASGRKVIAFAPVALCLVVAAGLAIWRAPTGDTRTTWWVSAGAVLVVLLMLVVGGLIVPSLPA